MTKQELCEILSRCFAVYILLKVVPYLGLIADSRLISHTDIKIHYIFLIGIEIVFAVVFWFGAKWIGQKLASNNKDIVVTEITYDHVLTALLLVAALGLVVHIIPDIVATILYYSGGKPPFPLPVQAVKAIVGAILAVCLIFGSKGFMRMVLKLRGK